MISLRCCTAPDARPGSAASGLFRDYEPGRRGILGGLTISIVVFGGRSSGVGHAAKGAHEAGPILNQVGEYAAVLR
jgi:hypothetical protein